MATDALIGTEIGSYRLTATLGVGGMGAVYLGEHPLIGKRVAVKILHAEFSDKQDVVMRFFNEARAVSQLHHPNIVELIDFGKLDLPGREEPLHYCVMELLEGETLRDRIKAQGMLTESDAIIYAKQIVDAVATAHRQQIIHRDLKPENVFLSGANSLVKILDFGIAKLQNANAQSMQTQAGVLLGTPSYMSPEQCMGKPVDARTDVYATGIILFEMVTGRVPFIGEGYADLLIKQITADVPSPRSINPAITEGFEKVIARALAKEPDARFQSMEEFARALDAPANVAGPTRAMPKAIAGDETIVKPYAVSTTLSGAVAELQEQAPPARKGGGGAVMFGLAALILAGGGAGGFFFLQKEKAAKDATVAAAIASAAAANNAQNGATTTPTAPPADKKAKLHIISDPAGADVKREDTGAVLGQTPLDTSLPADGSLMRIVLHKDGFKDSVRAVVLNERESSLSFRLVSDGTTPAPAVEKPAATKPEEKPSANPAEKPAGRPEAAKPADEPPHSKPAPATKPAKPSPDDDLAPVKPAATQPKKHKKAAAAPSSNGDDILTPNL